MYTISEQDFKTLTHFIQTNYGINLSQKKSLIENRLCSTISDLGYTDFSKYIKDITINRNSENIEIMLNKLTTNYTYFMRESDHFDFFKSTILPWIVSTKKDRSMSIWSAGCSSGEEPYTISMIIKEFLGASAASWDTRVLATDISQNILSKAIKAEYPEESLKNLPPGWKQKYFVSTGKSSQYSVSPAIKSNVIFRPFNLMEPIRFRSKFDVIFCRNVMIYFDTPTRDALVRRYFDATNPGGYLLIGHSESLNKTSTPYQYLMPATYRKQ